MNEQEKRAKQKTAKINQALGLFVLFFGVVILIAVFFTDTAIGKKTNLVVGIILCSIGGGMVWKARRELTGSGKTEDGSTTYTN